MDDLEEEARRDAERHEEARGQVVLIGVNINNNEEENDLLSKLIIFI